MKSQLDCSRKMIVMPYLEVKQLYSGIKTIFIVLYFFMKINYDIAWLSCLSYHEQLYKPEFMLCTILFYVVYFKKYGNF